MPPYSAGGTLAHFWVGLEPVLSVLGGYWSWGPID